MKIPLSLGKPSLRRRLEDYYSLIAPQTISNEKEWRQKFELIYEKYGGTIEREQTLAKNLAKKYGDAVKLVIVTNNEGSNNGNRALHIQNDKKDKNPIVKQNVHSNPWYDLTPTQKDSGIINFLHEDFDPVAALRVPPLEIFHVNPYAKDSPLLDNIDKFRFLLPKCDPLHKEIIPKSCNVSKDTVGKHPSTTEKMKNKIPVFTAMAAKYEQSGPLSLLHSIHVKRQRVRVTIRYVDCIRGVLTGYLIAFDKHMNMLLRDVDEVYTSRITKVLKGEEMTKSELELERRKCIEHAMNKDKNPNSSVVNPRVKVGKRHLQQILVRGDNIVSIWRADGEIPNVLLKDAP
jgi:small nuclear ribonucleoprotein (snRNP)-like protein